MLLMIKSLLLQMMSLFQVSFVAPEVPLLMIVVVHLSYAPITLVKFVIDVVTDGDW